MSTILEKTLAPEDEELQRKKASLAELEAQLADRELELATFLADLVHFESATRDGRGQAMSQNGTLLNSDLVAVRRTLAHKVRLCPKFTFSTSGDLRNRLFGQ